jgi:hypothetical protein
LGGSLHFAQGKLNTFKQVSDQHPVPENGVMMSKGRMKNTTFSVLRDPSQGKVIVVVLPS